MILRFIILLIPIFLIALFAVNNNDIINVKLYPFEETLHVRSYMVILISFLFGFLFSIPFFLLFKMGQSRNIKKNKDKIYCLQNEIETLKLGDKIKKNL